MKRQGGFTLIELVVVIVILGILAVTAAPRFLDLQGDARTSALQGLKGAMDGAAGIVYAKAAIAGIENQASTTNPAPTVGDDNITTSFGYPTANASGIVAAVKGLDTDWAYAQANGVLVATLPTTAITIANNGTTTNATIIATNCYVQYDEATAAAVANAATTTVVSTGC
ncbi:type II secretion system protein [Vibrio sp. Hal054]|uniref:type II secretion system protein n=1 Tax=Vibrio sp. Hal054 TaxID=3035158 RepID=UPI00301CE303